MAEEDTKEIVEAEAVVAEAVAVGAAEMAIGFALTLGKFFLIVFTISCSLPSFFLLSTLADLSLILGYGR